MITSNEGQTRKDEQWQKLLEWLKTEHNMDVGKDGLRVECRQTRESGKGLFASQPCSPSATLFTIPARAMINVKTLSLLYPPNTLAALNATQIISLHLFLHKPSAENISCDPSFGPYISSLPQDFSSHPLAWTQHASQHVVNQDLLSSLPSILSLALRSLRTRFREDWKAVREHLKANPSSIIHTARAELRHRQDDISEQAHEDAFMWAWLNVNTRCIYYRLNANQAAPENMAMCPILDLANHAPTNSHIFPVLPSSIFSPAPGARKNKSHGLGGDYMFLSTSERSIQTGEELFLKYGEHSNAKLFVEYGFVNGWSKGDCQRGGFVGEVNLKYVVEEIFEKRGAVGAWMRSVLEEEGYWGDWTMHSSPTPAHPSYRLMAALRLYHIVSESVTQLPSDHESLVDDWRRVLIGQQDLISSTNEQKWRDHLVELCERVAKSAELGLGHLASTVERLRERDTPPWFNWMVGNIRLLWQEELEVAEAVAHSVKAGEEF
ncbi:SET domain-containing protein [Trametopsis cervina]|nr:SET domain-containing protein [Trametopsis cervina]